MGMSTSAVGAAFWEGRAGTGGSVYSSGDKLFSYQTVLLQRLRSGKVLGNVSKYSPATSKHQSQVSVRRADTLTKKRVPRGATDLRPYV